MKKALTALLLATIWLVFSGPNVYATLGEYIGAGTSTMSVLFHFDGLTAATTTAPDSSGNGNTMKLHSATTSITAGLFGGGVGFNNTLTSNGSTTNTTGFSGNATFTISFWEKPSVIATTSADYEPIQLGTQASVGNASVWQSAVHPGDIFVQGNASNFYCGTSKGILNTSTWQNIIITHIGGTNVASTVLYYNGTPLAISGQGIAGGCGSGGFSITSAQSRVYIGCAYNTSNNGCGGTFFGGYLDEVIISSSSWTKQQVIQYYTRALARGVFLPKTQ